MLDHFPWPNLERGLTDPWMLFVDGENLTIQGEKFAASSGINLLPGPLYEPGSFLWVPGYGHSSFLSELAGANRAAPSGPPKQAHYYTTAVADEPAIEALRLKIREAGFKPHVFKKRSKGQKTKGVDISLARDLLVHGFEGGFSYALLVAGDQDYLPLVEELQSRRLAVFVTFFEAGMGPRLRAEADFYFPLDEPFAKCWNAYLFPVVHRHRVGAVEVTFHAKRVDPDPRLHHHDVDHVRLELRGHVLQLPGDGGVDRNMPGADLTAAVRNALSRIRGEDAAAMRDALSG